MISLEGLVDGGTVLVLGAHADDVEIGCSGTLGRLVESGASAIRWVVLSAAGARAEEARRAAGIVAGDCDMEVEILSFRERYFPHLPELKEWFDGLGQRVEPSLVLCPWKGDGHQDHAAVGRLAHETFRRQTILQYEIPKRDGDIGRPWVYVPLSDEQMDRKLSLLLGAFPSQRERDWFDEETFRGIARLRGVEVGGGARWAEAFHCERIVIG